MVNTCRSVDTASTTAMADFESGDITNRSPRLRPPKRPVAFAKHMAGRDVQTFAVKTMTLTNLRSGAGRSVSVCASCPVRRGDAPGAHFADCEHLFRTNVNGRQGGIARGANCSVGVHDRVGLARRKSYPRPPARLRSLYSRLAGGRRWVTRDQPMVSVVLFFRSDSPLRSSLCA